MSTPIPILQAFRNYILTNPRRHLEPGGYLELQDFLLPYTSDDGTLTADNPLYRAGVLAVEASKISGRPIDLAPYYKSYLEKAGFVDIAEKRQKWPLNDWAKDPNLKELGTWVWECHDKGAEGLFMALLTRFKGWTKEEVLVLCSEIRTALRNRNVHGYIPM